MNDQNCLALLHDCSIVTKVPLDLQRSQRLAQLTHLQSLKLHIPHGVIEFEATDALKELTSLSRLQRLNLRVCGIEMDAEPVEKLFAILSNITCLEIFSSAPIPRSCRIFHSPTNLQRLLLSYESIEHLEVLTSLRNLDHLTLELNMMKSKQFEYLNYLPKLTYLDCANNCRMLQDSFKYMSALTALQVFKMSQNDDTWGAEYGTKSYEYICNSMTNLTKLIWNWNFAGHLPDQFTILQQLRVFKQTEEFMNSSDMDKLLLLTNLTKLRIAVSRDSAPKVLLMTNLRSLSLYGDADYNQKFLLSELPNLTYLDFCC